MKNMCAPEERSGCAASFGSILDKEDGLAIYGLDPVLNALEKGEVEVALVTDTTDMIEIVVMCKKCGLSKAKIVNAKIEGSNCSGNDIEPLREMRRG